LQRKNIKERRERERKHRKLSFHSVAKEGMKAKDNAKQNSQKLGMEFSLREAFFMLGFMFCYISLYDPKTQNDS
jgi:hypothetical protein